MLYTLNQEEGVGGNLLIQLKNNECWHKINDRKSDLERQWVCIDILLPE